MQQILPVELVRHIYSYDDTYRQHFLHTVIPQMLRRIRDIHYAKLIAIEHDFHALQNLLLNEDFPFWLFIRNRKFLAIDKKYFNHFFVRFMYQCQSLCLYLYEPY